MERLGSPFGWGSAVDDLEMLADHWHLGLGTLLIRWRHFFRICRMDFAPIA